MRGVTYSMTYHISVAAKYFKSSFEIHVTVGS